MFYIAFNQRTTLAYVAYGVIVDTHSSTYNSTYHMYIVCIIMGANDSHLGLFVCVCVWVFSVSFIDKYLRQANTGGRAFQSEITSNIHVCMKWIH